MNEEENIEELKRLLYTDTLTQYGKRKLINYYEKQIEKLQKENEELKDLIIHKNEYTKKLEEDLFENCSNYVVSIQKIKDKIKELKQERISKYDYYMGYKIESREQQDIDKKIEVLQELIEENRKDC